MDTQGSGTSYEILQIAEDATLDEAKQAYRDLALVWHPDRFPNSPSLLAKAQEMMKRLNLAYETLSDSEKRKQYDAVLLSRALSSKLFRTSRMCLSVKTLHGIRKL